MLQPDDCIIVIGSDGVFEFVSNEEVAQIVYEYYREGLAESAANAVVKKAYQMWKLREDVVDDITCVVIFLHKNTVLKSRGESSLLKDITTDDNIIWEES